MPVPRVARYAQLNSWTHRRQTCVDKSAFTNTILGLRDFIKGKTTCASWESLKSLKFAAFKYYIRQSVPHAVILVRPFFSLVPFLSFLFFVWATFCGPAQKLGRCHHQSPQAVEWQSLGAKTGPTWAWAYVGSYEFSLRLCHCFFRFINSYYLVCAQVSASSAFFCCLTNDFMSSPGLDEPSQWRLRSPLTSVKLELECHLNLNCVHLSGWPEEP